MGSADATITPDLLAAHAGDAGKVGETEYRCPGERTTISHSAHLSRLAAGYAPCRNCSARNDVGCLPPHLVRRTARQLAQQQIPMISQEGIRGRYLNTLSRARMVSLTGQILNLLHEELAASEDRPLGEPLRIVTGHDGRSDSPVLAVGVVSVLRQSGCDVIDLGAVTRPQLDLATDQIRPDAALFVTGGCRPEGWTGLDVIGPDGIPWCLPGRLSQLSERLETPARRLSREAGRYRTLTVLNEYLSRLLGQFHALRPLRLGISCPDPVLRELLPRIFAETPCSLHLVSEQKFEAGGENSGSRNFAERLCERRFDVGFAIARDGRAVRMFDETGRELSLDRTISLIQLLSRKNERRPVLTRRMHGEPPAGVESTGTAVAWTDQTEADLIRTQCVQKLPVVADAEGRIRFLWESPACDALQTIARVLEALSLSGEPISAYR